MNPLLIAPPRTTTPIEFKSRPGLGLHVLTLNYLEFLAMGTAIKGLSEDGHPVVIEVEHTLCDSAGVLQLQPGEGEAFMRTISLADANALRKQVGLSNALSDEATEQTEKN